MRTIMKNRKLADRPDYPFFRMKDGSNSRNNFAPMNIIHNDDVYTVELELPGWSKDEVKIQIDKDTLKVSGEKTDKSEQKSDQKVHVQEFHTNRFFRSVILNDEVNQEKISAKMENGILIIELKKYADEEKPGFKKVEIQ